MCGILGFASWKAVKNKSEILKGAQLLNHRGPDDSGEWVSSDGKIGLSHRRLSIVDLSSKGRQPMSDTSNRYRIVFNGEIYNYKELFDKFSNKGYEFHSKTDTEVILASYIEWGENCTSHLNGMFAFAIFDSEKNTLFLSRDRAGEKPLYYAHKDGIFRFCSEIKGLLNGNSIKPSVNKSSLDYYLSLGFVPGSRCIIDGFYKLPPASSLLLDVEKQKFKVWKYWNLPNQKKIAIESGRLNDNLVDELESLLENSIQKQMVADVDVGVLLSGGVDSSLITALASRNKDKVKTFTVSFPGHEGLDETKYARLISNHFKTEHFELNASEIDIDLFSKLAYQYDEPIIDSSMIPTFLLCELVQNYCKVVMGGDGGDELFGGYEHYSRLIWTNKNLKLIPSAIQKTVSQLSENILPIGFKGRNWLQSLNVNLNNDLPLIANYFDSKYRKKLMSKVDSDWPTPSNDFFKINKIATEDLLERATHMDFSNYLAEDILVKVDRASMFNSLEVRSPFLDKDLIEFAFNKVPSNLKANSTQKKILLKRLSCKLLPKDFDRTRKQGFKIPLNDWLKQGKYRDFFYNVLLDSNTIFDKKIVLKLFKYQDLGMNNGERLFALVMFELWRRQHKISI